MRASELESHISSFVEKTSEIGVPKQFVISYGIVDKIKKKSNAEYVGYKYEKRWISTEYWIIVMGIVKEETNEEKRYFSLFDITTYLIPKVPKTHIENHCYRLIDFQRYIIEDYVDVHRSNVIDIDVDIRNMNTLEYPKIQFYKKFLSYSLPYVEYHKIKEQEFLLLR